MSGDNASDQWAANSVTMISISELSPYEDNPRIHTPDQITAIENSIREWGWTIPVVIDESKMIIAGHGRVLAGEQMGITEVPCITAKGWTDEQKRAYVIADNKIQEKGQWDHGAVFRQLRDLASDDFDVSLIDFDLDLSSFNYSPDLEPVTRPASSFIDITMDDFAKARSKLDDQVSGMHQHSKGAEVVCPHCYETFEFHGS